MGCSTWRTTAWADTYARGNGNRIAIIAEREDGDAKLDYTYAELDSLSVDS